MPNFCENYVEIKGSKTEIRNFIDLVTPKFDFEKVLPIPNNCDNTDLWVSNTWGTNKKALGDVTFKQINNKEITFVFLTSWSPPKGIYKKLKELFPKLKIKWEYMLEQNNKVKTLK